MEQQILDTLNQYIAENPGYQLNDKTLEQIHASAKSYDRLVNDQHYQMANLTGAFKSNFSGKLKLIKDIAKSYSTC